MRKNLYVLIILLSALLSSSRAYADREFLSHYTQTLYNAESGMDANDSSSVIQTSDGYIWTASYSGLIRFDGKEFVRFSSDAKSGFTAISATTLFEDYKGTLWVGTNESGLFYRGEGKFVQVKNSGEGAFSSIRSIAANSKGQMYVGSGSGLGIVENETIKKVSDPATDSEFILGMVFDRDDRLWCVTRNGGLFIMKDGRHIKNINTDAVKNHKTLSILLCRDGRIFAGLVEGGIAELSIVNDTLKVKKYNTGSLDAINGLYEDSDGLIWACGDNGLGFLDKTSEFHVAEGALVNSNVEKVFQDYESNYWVASSRQGLLHIAKNKFMDINFAVLAQRDVVNSTLRHNNHLYIGTDSGLSIVDSSYKNVETALTKDLKGVRVRCLKADSRGTIWISTYKNLGLISVSSDGKTKYYAEKDGLPDAKVRLTMELANGDIAVGTNGGGAIIRDGKIIKAITESDGLTNKTILSLSETPDGTVYFGSDGGGIFALSGDKLTNYSKKNGLTSGVILRMLYDPSSEGTWISTGSRLCFMNKENKVRELDLNFPVKSGIFDLKISPHGRLMVLADTGVHILDQKDLLDGQKPYVVSYTRKDGFASTVTANSWSDMDRHVNLYICGSNGVYSINVNNVYMNNVSPKIAINRVQVDDKTYINPQSITISKDTQRLTIDVAVLSFANPDYNRIKYSLNGFDQQDISGSAKSMGSISYTNLSGGNYTFVFDAFNSDGIPNRIPIQLDITKEKHLFEEPMVLSLIAMAVVGSIFLATRFFYAKKNKLLLKRQDELRNVTEQAMTAIANTIDAKDTYTKGHSTRVAKYAVKIAEKLGLDRNSIDNLYYTALLHDIGKIGVPDNILNKPARLTDEEYQIMKQHPTSGGNILEVITTINDIKDGAAYHHERYDGTGYNKGLKGEEIPLAARIIGVADAVDAMGSTRPYRTCRNLDYVISELEKHSGTQFDPKLAAILIDLLKSGEVKLEEG